jgi:hypothetical protein
LHTKNEALNNLAFIKEREDEVNITSGFNIKAPFKFLIQWMMFNEGANS